jgi:hypothetical protein
MWERGSRAGVVPAGGPKEPCVTDPSIRRKRPDAGNQEGSFRARKANLQAMRSPASIALGVFAIAAVFFAFGYQAITQNSVLLSYVRDAIGSGS